MRHKRAKTYKRLMAVYVQTFGFRQPFQVLVSNDLLIHSSKNKEADLPRQLQACLQGPVKLMITQCCMEALYKLGRDAQRTTNLAKTFERRKCNHREAQEPDACLKDMIGETNKHNYVLATQSKDLLQSLDIIPGVPILHFNKSNVLVLSPPGRATLRKKDEQELERRKAEAGSLEGVEDGGNVIGAGMARKAGEGTRGKKTKAPNPLSVKKKKAVAPVAVPASGSGATGKGKRRMTEEEEDGEGEGDRAEGGREGADPTGAGAGSREGEEGGDQPKKKRKRKHKGAMAKAREETAALFAGKGPVGDNAGEDGGDDHDDESD